MKLSLFISGKKTYLGIEEDNSIRSVEINSKILFFDPELFKERLLLIIKNIFGVSSFAQNDSLIFALTGLIDEVTGKIIFSYNLNEISFAKKYEGYNFKETFGDIIEANNITVINDAKAVSYGVLNKIKPPLPCLVITDDIGLGVSTISDSEVVESIELGPEYIVENKNIHHTLSENTVNQILSENKKDIVLEYTKLLIAVLQVLLKLAREKINVKSLVILSERSELILQSQIRKVFNELEFFFPEKNKHSEIFLAGCFNIPQRKFLPKIQKIEYHSGDELIYSFDNHKDFVDHWKSYHGITNSTNEYHIIYSDNSTRKIKIGSISFEEELKQYSF